MERTIKVTRKGKASVRSNLSEAVKPSGLQFGSEQANYGGDEEVRYISHIQDVAWEDNNAPDLKGSEKLNYMRVRHLVAQMIKARENAAKTHPDGSKLTSFPRIIVHCSAGTGRTGTLISAYCIVESLLHTYRSILSGECQVRYEADPYYCTERCPLMCGASPN